MAASAAARHLVIVVLLATAISGTRVSGAESVNYHDFFEGRCGSCHGHSGDLAREQLVIVDGRLLGRESGNDIRSYLAGHYGRLSPDQVARVYAVLFRQGRAGGLFKTKCRICHGRARELAKTSLVVVAGQLRGRYSGRDVGAFLKRHGRLEDREVKVVYEALLALARGGG
ncbi:MAG: hypothetical protein QF893_02215 [Alphaproteobacteria bacterium]|jgi:hypothetical protein|nr:hypothetical protein [Alphaproteobacteria bacterium]